MMDFNGHMSTGGWIFSVLGLLILLALVVGLVAVLASTIGNRRAQEPANPESAQQILDRRLATGEITIEQYERMHESLARSADSLPRNHPTAAGSGS